MPTNQLNTDVALGVTIPARNARGRLARIGPALDAVLSSHNYPPAIEKLLAEALVLTALLGAMLKEPQGQVTLQAQTESGIVDLLVCDYRAGELRGYVRHDPDRLAEAGPSPSLFALFGKGYLAITFDQPVSDERYQGIVPLEGESLARAAESFFAQSEQIPSIVRLAAEKREEGWSAGGLLFQHLPEGEEGRERLHTRLDHPDWPHVAILAGSVKAEELTDPALPLDELTWRLFHEEAEVRTLEPIPLAKAAVAIRIMFDR
jgi:molecular chaperone Hsp33